MNIMEEIHNWREEKLIPNEYLDVLEKRYEEKEGESSRFVYILATLGALLIGLGIITYMAANWTDFSRFFKTGFLLGMLVIIYASATYFNYKKMIGVSVALFLLGGILFGANIMLLAQTFNIQSHYPNGVLFWWLGIFPITYLIRSKALFLLNFALFLIWIFLEFFIALSEANISGYFIIFVSILIFLNFLMTANYLKEKVPDFTPYLRNVGLMGTFISLFILTIPFFNQFDIIWGNISFVPYDTIIFLIILISLLVSFVVHIFNSKQKQERYVLWLLITALLLSVIPFIIGISEVTSDFFTGQIFLSNNIFSLLSKILFIVITLMTVNLGTKLKKNSLINFGVGFFALEILYIYFDFARDLMDTSAFFLTFGILLLSLGYFLEKKRKSLISENE